MKALALVFFTVLSTCAIADSVGREQADSAELSQEQFNAEADELRAQLDAKKITELQFAKKAVEVVKRHLPTDYDAHTLFQYRVLLATKYQEKKISKAELDYLFIERQNAYLAKRHQEELRIKAEQDYFEARQRIAERDAQRNAMEREQRIRDERLQAAAAREEAERQQQAINTANALRGIGNAFRGATQQPGVRCTSVPVGASVSTTCY